MDIVPVLERNGISIEFTKDELISLTQIWRMAGSPANQQPAKWKRLPESKKLISRIKQDVKVCKKHYGTGGGFEEIIKVNRGGNNPETFAHYKLAIEYAAYLDVEFKSWMLGIVGDYIESPEEFAADILIQSHNKERQERALKRVRVAIENKRINELSARHGVPYPKAHDDRALGLYGKTTKQLRAEGDVEKETPINYLSELDITYISAANGMVIKADNLSLMCLAAAGIAELHERITGEKLNPAWDKERLTPAKARKITTSAVYQMELPLG